MRKFESGATRNSDDGKYDYEAFLSPIVLERYAAYMHKHRIQDDGSLRDGDNWMRGIPRDAYIKSAWRHFHAFWMAHRGYETEEDIEESMMALLFNVMGYAFEYLKDQDLQTKK